MHRCTLISLGSVCVFLVKKDKRLQIECELMKGYSFPLHLTSLMVYGKILLCCVCPKSSDLIHLWFKQEGLRYLGLIFFLFL